MKSLSLIFAAAAFATPALAHPPGEDGGHGNSAYSSRIAEQPRPTFTPAAAQAKAQNVLGTLIERKIVGQNWRGVAPTKAETREKSGSKEWIVTFRNDREPVRAKRTLYVLLTETGDYKAANHTGA